MGGPADQTTGKPVTVTLGRREFSLPEAEAYCRRFANGFFWIAGLSLLNMIMTATDAGYSMILGLGITQLLQEFAQMLQSVAQGGDDPDWPMVSYILGSAAISLFVFLGWRARRIERWPFIVGMSLYALDSLIFLAARHWVAVGFHLFWLNFLWAGLRAVTPIRAARRLIADESDAQPQPLPAFLHSEPVRRDGQTPAAPSGA